MIREELIVQKKANFKGNIYEYTQVNFAYHSNKIEENRLSKEQVEMSTILKRNTADELNPRYNIGGFKIIPNVIGVTHVIKTTSPENVE